MKEIWNIIKIIFHWLWTLILLITIVTFLIELHPNLFYTKYVGASIIGLITIRRIMIFFSLFKRKINSYVIFFFFLFGASLSILGEFLSQSSFKGDNTAIVIFLGYSVGIYTIYKIMASSGFFGKAIKEKIRKKELKREQEKEKNKEIINTPIIKEEKQKIKEIKQNKPEPKKNVDYVYCKNCGDRSTNPMALVKNKCGIGKYRGQKHILYEGGVKDKYICKHCGRKFPNIKAMAVTKSCNTADKFHEPML